MLPLLTQVDLSNDMRKTLLAASKLCKKNNDSYLGVDTLVRALLENKDIAQALSEAGAVPHRPPSTF